MLATPPHPSELRIQRLTGETLASLVFSDRLLAPSGKDLGALGLSERRRALEDFVASIAQTPALSLTPGTADRTLAQTWIDEGKLEGVVAKWWDGPYLEGERAIVKVKRARTADCVVGEFRFERGGAMVGSAHARPTRRLQLTYRNSAAFRAGARANRAVANRFPKDEPFALTGKTPPAAWVKELPS